MAINATRIKNLAAEYIQAEERVEKLKRYTDYLGKGQCGISEIYIISRVAAGVPIEITAGMDKEFMNDTYLTHVLNGVYDEIVALEQHMEKLLKEIKKELHL